MKPIALKILQAGFCTCPEHFAIQGGRWRRIPFPAMFVLLDHPRFGPMLFDTGYSSRFFEETRTLLGSLYRLLTPVTFREEESAAHQLAKFNLKTSDITRIFISHFHVDHVSALADFEKAKYVYLPEALHAVQHLRGLRAVARSFFPGLLPPDFVERSATLGADQSCPLPPQFEPFSRGYDLLGDGSIYAVDLPGHATGQMGIFVQSDGGETFFFVADAAWLARSVRENRPPDGLIRGIFPQPEEYDRTLSRLHQYQAQHPGVVVIPSHCAETLNLYAAAG